MILEEKSQISVVWCQSWFTLLYLALKFLTCPFDIREKLNIENATGQQETLIE